MKIYIIIMTLIAIFTAIAIDNTVSVVAILLLSNVFLMLRGAHKNTLRYEFEQNAVILFSSVVLTMVIYLPAVEQIEKYDVFFLIVTFHALYSFNSTCSLYSVKLVKRIKNKLF